MASSTTVQKTGPRRELLSPERERLRRKERARRLAVVLATLRAHAPRRR